MAADRRRGTFPGPMAEILWQYSCKALLVLQLCPYLNTG